MIRRVLLILLLATGLRAEESDPEPETLSRVQIRQLLRDARRLYDAQPEEADAESRAAHAEAARAFARAAEAGDPGEVNLDAVRLAEAMAWMRADQPELALEAFDRIQGFDEALDRARHRFLRGNAHLAAGEAALSREDFEEAKTQMGEAVESLISSLMEDPQAEAAKQNLEVARRRLRWVEENEPPPPPPEEEPGEDDSEEEDTDPDETPPPDMPDMPEPQDDEDEQETDPDGDEDDGAEAADADAEEGDEGEDEEEAEPGEPEWTEDVDGAAAADDPEFDDLDMDTAEQTLDALLEQERRLREEIIRNRRIRTIPVEKDW